MIGKIMTTDKARLENPLALAFVGDTVFDLYVRTFVLQQGVNSHKMHVLSVKYVSAAAQAAAFNQLEPILTDDEMYIWRRGRNTKPTTVPKNAQVKDYRCATGLETLVGYLYLTGQKERLDHIMDMVLNHQNQLQNHHQNHQNDL